MNEPIPRRLFLLRHAKASRDEPGLDDFDRPLTERGLDDAARIGQVMADRGWWPRRALVSPAVRTRQTWGLAARELPKRTPPDGSRAAFGQSYLTNLPPGPGAAPGVATAPGHPPDNVPQAFYMPALYRGDGGVLLSVLRDMPTSVVDLVVVGHNPAMENLAALLASVSSDEQAMETMLKKYPTCALAVFNVEIEWSELAPGSLRLTDFVRPKDLY
ncbi:MAG: histidine phosphatase family protein [Rhizobiaceae bacterium]|nr:histidine phosphatase family protein [Rhizobiaceae bacterium]MCV0406478.1 histidine phosphatase family protein [Rhizobiaceae bacterium]